MTARRDEGPREQLERLGRRYGLLVRFAIVRADGPEHARRFTARCEVVTARDHELAAEATEANVKAARAAAASLLLAQLAGLPAQALTGPDDGGPPLWRRGPRRPPIPRQGGHPPRRPDGPTS